jgi:hypothetical protein
LGWDVGAAGRVWFKMAYCLILARETWVEVFGKMNVVAEGLVELGRGGNCFVGVMTHVGFPLYFTQSSYQVKVI